MKKAFVALMVVAMALVAQANVWNLDWSILGALAPEDPGDMSVSLFDNYGITWELINASAGDSVIASTSLVNGSVKWDDSANGGDNASFSDWLQPETGTKYFGSTDLTSAQSIYQKITLISQSGDEYVWQSNPISVTPIAKDEATAAPLSVGGDIVLAGEGVQIEGMTMATWTKTTTIPEPATMSLLGLGALAMVLRRRIRR